MAASATSSGVTQFEGLFKEVYADNIEDLTPITDQLARDIKFVPESQREGNSYNQPVQLTHETGWTFNTDGSAFSLNNVASSVDKNASISGAECVIRSAVSYGAMQKALKAFKEAGGGKAGLRAFANATREKFRNMVDSMSKAREIQLLYGGGTTGSSNLGVIASDPGTGPGNRAVTLTAASWSTAIWSGMEGASVDVYSGSTQISNAAAMVVESVDPANYQITLSGNEGDLDDIGANDTLHFYGAYGKEMTGIDVVAGNTGSLHGISASTYQLWKASSFSVGGQLTFGKLMQGLQRPAALGFHGEMNVYCNPAAWWDLNEDLAALRRVPGKGAGGEVQQGFDSIKYYSQVGTVVIKPHIYCKRGEAFAFPAEYTKRVGATDVTFEMPDSNGRIFRQMSSNAGVEYRGYYNQNLFLCRPAYLVKYTGIVPNAAEA